MTSFILRKATLEASMKLHKKSWAQIIKEQLQEISLKAQPPISKFNVGALLECSNGLLYAGVNIEFPGTPLNNSIHAEQFAIVSAIQHAYQLATSTSAATPAPHFPTALYINAGPCGHCRQFMCEISNIEKVQLCWEKAQPSSVDPRPAAVRGVPGAAVADTTSSIGATNDGVNSVTQQRAAPPGVAGADEDVSNEMMCTNIQHVLPERFGPEALLGDEAGLGIFAWQVGGRAVLDQAGQEAAEKLKRMVGDDVGQGLIDRGVQEMIKSYCPYTLCPASVVLAVQQGNQALGLQQPDGPASSLAGQPDSSLAVYSGCVYESCAYNPTLPPLQSAIINATVGGMTNVEQIQHVVLFEIPSSAVRYQQQVRAIVDTWTHNVHVHLITCTRFRP